MTKRREQITGRTAISICLGHLPRLESLHDGDVEARAYCDRKQKRTNAPIAHSALSHKLARAAFYIMRDGVPFMPEKMFA